MRLTKKNIILVLVMVLILSFTTPVTSYNEVQACGTWQTWKQSDPCWGPRRLGNLCTMSNSGCLITSIAIVMRKSGAEVVNPGSLRDRYESRGFVSHNSSSIVLDGNLNAAAYSKANSPNFYSVGRANYHPTPYNAIYNDISSHLSKGEYAVVNVNYGGHWVAVDRCANGTVYIVDPAKSGKTTLKQYDGGIEQAIFFAKKASKPSKAITISGYNTPPATLKYKKCFSVYGTVKSGYKLTKVEAGVYTTKGKFVTVAIAKPNKTSYSIKTLDRYIYFNKCKKGTYYYKIKATNSAGKTVILVNRKFKIK